MPPLHGYTLINSVRAATTPEGQARVLMLRIKIFRCYTDPRPPINREAVERLPYIVILRVLPEESMHYNYRKIINFRYTKTKILRFAQDDNILLYI